MTTLSRSLPPFAILAVLQCTACAPKIDTQTHRYQYLESHVEKAADEALKCKHSTVTFLETSDIGVAEFDHYQVEGCGQSTEMMTNLTMVGSGQNKVIIRRIMAVPPADAFPAAAKEQLAPTARFALDCPEPTFQDLGASMTPMREAYSASIGATGCGKKATYKVVCQYVGFNAGQHPITCSSTADGVPSAN